MSRNPDHLLLKWLHRAGNRLYLKENQDWYESMEKPQKPQNITDIREHSLIFEVSFPKGYSAIL